MSSKQQRIPAIRFKGFIDDWEQRKLGDLADIIGGGTPSTSNPEYWNGIIDWYSPVEIGEQIYVNGSQKTITELGLQKSSAKILPVGTVLFTSRAGIGNTAILAKEGATNQGFQSIVPNKNKLDSYFIFSRTHELKRYGETNGAGSTFIEVSGKQMANMPILIPQLEEQIKIGNFFKEIDNTIALHQRQLNNYKLLKNSMIQKMFPQSGEQLPKIRFAGFSGKWERKKFGEIVEISRGLTYKPADVVSDGVRVLRSSNIKQDIFETRADDIFVRNDAANIPEVKNGDILVTAANGSTALVGKHAIVDNISSKTVHGGFMLVIRCKNNYFINTWMSSSEYRRVLQLVQGGNGAIGNLSKNMLEEAVIGIPSDEEQIQIA